MFQDVTRMDKFDQYMEGMKGCGPEDVRILIEENKKKCVCAKCPSYNECAARKRELLYCLVGKSGECHLGDLGCICPECPVTVELDLSNIYFCRRGSEKEMRRPEQ